MKNIKLYVRTDLRTSSKKRISNGKMASQSAHALMAIVLALFEKKEDKLVLFKENEAFFEELKSNKINISIYPLKSLEDFNKVYEENKENAFVIEDQGRTSFSTPTITTMGIAPSGLKYQRFTDCRSELGDVYGAKQTLVINKEEIIDKWKMFEVVSKCSIQFILNETKKINGNYELSLENKGFKAWIEGAFAKITIKPNEKTFDEFKNIIQSSENDTYKEIYYENDKALCVAIGADFIDVVDKYTKNGFSLA